MIRIKLPAGVTSWARSLISPDNGFVSDICILTAQDVRCPPVSCVLCHVTIYQHGPVTSPTKKVLKPFFLFNFPLIISFETNSEMQT